MIFSSSKLGVSKFLTLSNVAKSAQSNLSSISSKKTRSTIISIQYFTPSSKRTYIRPHYYENKPGSLSNAMKAQSNPFRQLGRRINNLNPNKVLWSIIGTNIGVYLMWQYAINNYKQFRDDRWLDFMAKNFLSSSVAFEHGRIHTLLTSSISHKSLDHLGLNMLVLYSIGQGVMEAVGASRFLLLYAGAGITSALAGIAYQKWIRPRLEQKGGKEPTKVMGSLGASGSVMGITTFFACAYPRATFLVFFVIPMPAIAVVGLFAAYDIYKASTLNSGIIDSAGHIGGAAYGAGYWFLRVRPLLRGGRWRI